MANNRIAYLDNLKAFAIFLVVLGHSIQYIDRGDSNGVIFNIIYSFHMPLFMTISGYFFLSSLKLAPFELLKKKTITLLLPALVWSIPKLVMSSGSTINIILYNVWFLKSCFLSYIIFYVLYKCLPEKIVPILVLLISIFIPMNLLPGHLNMMLPCFGFGVLIRKNQEFILRKSTIIDILLLVLYVGLFVFWNFDYNTYISPWFGLGEHCFINSMAIWTYIYRMIIAIVAVLLIIRVSSLIESTNSYISFIGVNTLAIYLMNGLFSDVLMHVEIGVFNTPLMIIFIVAVTVIQLIVYIPLISFINKYFIFRFVLFGKK